MGWYAEYFLTLKTKTQLTLDDCQSVLKLFNFVLELEEDFVNGNFESGPGEDCIVRFTFFEKHGSPKIFESFIPLILEKFLDNIETIQTKYMCQSHDPEYINQYDMVVTNQNSLFKTLANKKILYHRKYLDNDSWIREIKTIREELGIHDYGSCRDEEKESLKKDTTKDLACKTSS